MSAQEIQPNTNGKPTLLGRNFTAEEAARLHQLRAAMSAQAAEYREGSLDERRVEFARWLIATGRLHDND